MDDENRVVDDSQQTKSTRVWKWILIAAGVVALAGLLVGAALFFAFSDEEVEEKTPLQTTRPRVAEPVHVNDVLALEPLVVNLADEGTLRYARIGVSLGLVSKSPGTAIFDERLMIPRLRDKCLTLVGQKSSAELGSQEVIEGLKKSIAGFINERVDPGKGRVSEVYFTEFVIQ